MGELGERFTESGIGAVTTQCQSCKHIDDGPAWTCKAFPDGIPDPIILNKADHRKPYAGDHGVRFEPADDAPPAYLGGLYKALDALDALDEV